jgi:hypothetical protein
MATAAQIAANRANAQKSTGPRTTAGKQRSSMNPLKHGLTAATLVLPHEDEIGYQETRGMLYTQYQPATPQECMLVDQLASSWWRTIRARQCETDMLHLQIETLKRKNPEKPASPVSDRQALASRFITEPEEDFRKFFRYEAAIERAFYRAVNTLEKLQAARLRREAKMEQEAKIEQEDPRPPLEDTLAQPSPEPPPPRLIAQSSVAQPAANRSRKQPIGFVSQHEVERRRAPLAGPRPAAGSPEQSSQS